MFISVAIHVVVLSALAALLRPAARPVVTYIALDDAGGREVGIPGIPSAARRAAAPATRSQQPPAPAERPSMPRIAGELPTPSSVAVHLPPIDSFIIDTHGALEPAYGDGFLWVHVTDVNAGNLPVKRQVAEMPDHVARVDSALAEKIRSYLDTMPVDSFATRSAPNWTTKVAGQTWGLDGKWIYLGPIKIPATILAMLPLPSGNYDLSQRNIQLQQMREDLMQAAWRAQSAEEFKRYVKEVRERKEVEHQQRVPPDTTKKTPLIP